MLNGHGNGHNGYGPNGNGGHKNGNGNGHGHGSANPAAGRLSDLYRTQASRERRARQRDGKGSKSPMILGSGVLVAFFGLFFAGILVFMHAGVTAYAALTEDLPSTSRINDHSTFKTAQIFDRNGELLWEFYSPEGGRRTVIPLSEMSQNLIDATLAAEDAYFYQHQGVDVRATLRSAIMTSSGESRSGASTLTQQLVRNVILDPEEAAQVTISRKLREIILAYELTQRLSKDEVLEMYLNEVYYGSLAYGVEAAAQSYFDKHARDLTLPEAALLAGLVQSPSAYDPTRRDLARTADGIPIATKERQAYVLEQMARHGFITEQQARDAYAEPLNTKSRDVELKSPHWVMFVRDWVEQKYGPKVLYEGGLKIYTTLDHNYNEMMREVLNEAMPNVRSVGGNNAAMINVNPKTGEILAFNGSIDYYNAEIDGQVNVLLNERQPGSSIKSLVYAAAFERGWAPGTFISDAPTCWADRPGNQWCPVNFDNQFHGETTARSALGNSLNIPAVKALEHAGIDYAVELGRKMGITSWGEDSGKHYGLSLTLGGAEVRPIDLAQVYTTLANNGLEIPLVAITRIIDAEGNILEDYKVPQGDQVLDPRAAYMITDILADPNAKLFTYGTNTPLVFKDRPGAAKTGTTDNHRDTWTAGYVPSLAAVVWVGNTGGAPMGQVLSSMTAGKIWPEAMLRSFEYFNIPPEDFVRPDGLVERQVCGDTRMRPGAPACRNDLFFAERAPSGTVGSPPAPAPGQPRQPQPAPGQQAQQPTSPNARADQPSSPSQPAFLPLPSQPLSVPTPGPAPAAEAPVVEPSTAPPNTSTTAPALDPTAAPASAPPPPAPTQAPRVVVATPIPEPPDPPRPTAVVPAPRRAP